MYKDLLYKANNDSIYNIKLDPVEEYDDMIYSKEFIEQAKLLEEIEYLETLIARYGEELNAFIRDSSPIGKEEKKEFAKKLFGLVDILSYLRKNWDEKISKLNSKELALHLESIKQQAKR